MREAARIAGILKRRPGVSKTVLTFISEPEAAALATLKRINGRCDIEVSGFILNESEIHTDKLKIAK